MINQLKDGGAKAMEEKIVQLQNEIAELRRASPQRTLLKRSMKRGFIWWKRDPGNEIREALPGCQCEDGKGDPFDSVRRELKPQERTGSDRRIHLSGRKDRNPRMGQRIRTRPPNFICVYVPRMVRSFRPSLQDPCGRTSTVRFLFQKSASAAL